MTEGLERNIRLFDKPGEKNTKETFEKVAKRIEQIDLNYLVVATTTGETGAKAAEFLIDTI